MAHVSRGRRSRTGWYERQESVGPGSSSRAGSTASPCCAHDNVRPEPSVTLDTPETERFIALVALLPLFVLRCALVMLRCARDRRYPALAPLHPDLVFGLQLEGRVIETSEPNLDVRTAGIGCVEEPRPTARAEAATVIARDLAAYLERLDRPVRIHRERTARLLSAIRAVAAPDVRRLAANAVADRPAEASADANSGLHARRCYATRRRPAFGNVSRVGDAQRR